MVSKNTTQLASLFVECILYGIFLVTFFTAMSGIFLHGQETRKILCHWKILLAALLIFASATLNVTLGLARLIEAFAVDVAHDGAVEALGDNWMNLAKALTVAIQSLLVNAILSWRCWIIWGKSYAVIVLPILLWLASAACTIALGIFEGTKLVSSATLGPAIIRWPIVLLGLELPLNLYGTGMIVYKLWRMGSQTAVGSARPRPSKLRHAMRVVVDSALLQAITCAIMLGGIAAQSYPAGFIASAADVQIAGIAYNLILIRITRERPIHMRGGPSEAISKIDFSSNPECHADSVFYGHTDITLSPRAHKELESQRPDRSGPIKLTEV